jgi:23S rRNA pseudouridine1911/1915/1917 synthase
MSDGWRELPVTASDDGARVDAFVSRRVAPLSLRLARELCADGRVTRAGRALKKGDRVASGDVLRVRVGTAWLRPESRGWLSCVYTDDDVVVVDKPAGVPAHPMRPGEGGTLVDALSVDFPEIADAGEEPREAGLVHRLDTGTSGLLAVARNVETWRRLRAAFSAGEVARAYVAVVAGRVSDGLVVDAPVAHDAGDRRRMVCVEEEVRHRGEPRPARTQAVPLAATDEASVVLAVPTGGVRHHIRVQLAHAGHPLLGDALYGGPPAPEREGHALHAARLRLPGGPLLESAPPADLERVCQRLGLDLREAWAGRPPRGG